MPSLLGYLKSKTLVVLAGVALLAALVGAVAFAAPGGGPAGGPGGVDPTETIEPTDLPDPTDLPEPTETPEPDELGPDAAGAGVPADSPACAGDLEQPNPHDTDGDGDGCRPVETGDGEKNLPDPAADAHEGTPGRIGELHRPPHSMTPGPPEGDPPHGNARGHDDEEP